MEGRSDRIPHTPTIPSSLPNLIKSPFLSLQLFLSHSATPFPLSPFPSLLPLLFPSLPIFSPCKCSTQKHAALKELLALALECDSLLCCYEVRHLSPKHTVSRSHRGPVLWVSNWWIALQDFQKCNSVLNLCLLHPRPCGSLWTKSRVTPCNSTAAGERCLMLWESMTHCYYFHSSYDLGWWFCTFMFLKLYVSVISLDLVWKSLRFFFFFF